MSVVDSPDKKRIIPPMGRWFTLLDHFDEVPLPDGRLFSRQGSVLLEKRGGTWECSEISVNELLDCISGLGNEEWRAVYRNCSGDEDAQQWRDWILNYKLPCR